MFHGRRPEHQDVDSVIVSPELTASANTSRQTLAEQSNNVALSSPQGETIPPVRTFEFRKRRIRRGPVTTRGWFENRVGRSSELNVRTALDFCAASSVARNVGRLLALRSPQPRSAARLFLRDPARTRVPARAITSPCRCVFQNSGDRLCSGVVAWGLHCSRTSRFAIRNIYFLVMGFRTLEAGEGGVACPSHTSGSQQSTLAPSSPTAPDKK